MAHADIFLVKSLESKVQLSWNIRTHEIRNDAFMLLTSYPNAAAEDEAVLAIMVANVVMEEEAEELNHTMSLMALMSLI